MNQEKLMFPPAWRVWLDVTSWIAAARGGVVTIRNDLKLGFLCVCVNHCSFWCVSAWSCGTSWWNKTIILLAKCWPSLCSTALYTAPTPGQVRSFGFAVQLMTVSSSGNLVICSGFRFNPPLSGSDQQRRPAETAAWNLHDFWLGVRRHIPVRSS